MSRMFNLDNVKGILLAIARPELTIYQNEKKNIGYEIRIRVNIRADSPLFLEEIQRELAVNNIECNLKYSESKIRPKPILWISGIRNIVNVCGLLEEEIASKADWKMFSKAAHIIYNDEHNTQKGLDELLRLKGEII
jgi:hypothetical protein